MKMWIRLILIIILTFPFLLIQTITADENKEDTNTTEELTGCDLSDRTIPPYLTDSEVNYTNKREKERKDTAPASFSWQSYMPPIRVHKGGAT